jgi:hypothetical protein
MNENPYSYRQLVNEISELTGLDQATVEEKVWAEALNPGHNVACDAANFSLDFHVYGEQMERFYREADGFIFETMAEACRNGKRAVMEVIKRRIENYLETRKTRRINILMLGDGTGSDTLYLSAAFKDAASLFYFDVPGSKTFEFATRRFERQGAPVEIITDYERIPRDFFDTVVSLEVLEHLPQPSEAIGGMSGFMKTGAISLITESFGAVGATFPTHLKSNLRYVGHTPLMFLKHNLLLTFYNRQPGLRFRPMEFTKKSAVNFSDKLSVYADRDVIKPLVKNFIKRTVKREA